MSQCWSNFGTKGLLPGAIGHATGCRGKHFGTEYYLLWIKLGKEKDLASLRRNDCMKTWDKRIGPVYIAASQYTE